MLSIQQALHLLEPALVGLAPLLEALEHAPQLLQGIAIPQHLLAHLAGAQLLDVVGTDQLVRGARAAHCRQEAARFAHAALTLVVTRQFKVLTLLL